MVHSDFAGPFLDRKVMIMVDAISKCPEGLEMWSTFTKKTTEVLRLVFATHGLPEQVVNDNGLALNLNESKRFMRINGIKQLPSSLSHLFSNGLAECLIEAFIQMMKRGAHQGQTVQQKIGRLLVALRYNTPFNNPQNPN